MTPAPEEDGAARSPFGYAVVLLLLAALWIAQRPYRGVAHDARLYMAQALRRIEPDNFQTDLFFRYGSQDSYSVFSAVFAPAVKLLGPGWAHLLFSVAGQLFWFSALLFLVVALFGRGRQALAAAIGAIVLVPYFASGVLSYSEVFVTPRMFAEAMVMLSLASVLQGRIAASIALAGVALLFHPLMALPGALVVLLLVIPYNRWVLFAGLFGAFLFAALALLGVDPFSRVLMRLDPEWHSIVLGRAQLAFVQSWGWKSIFFGAMPIIMFVLAYPAAIAAQKRLMRAVAIVAILGVLVSWLAGDVLRDLLVLNVQPWRGLWLVTLFGNIFAATAVLALPPETKSRGLLIAALIANVCENSIVWMPTASPILAICGMAVLLMERGLKRPLPFYLRLPPTIVALGAIIYLFLEFGYWMPWRSDLPEALLMLGRLAGIFLAIYLLLNWEACKRLRPRIALAAAFVPAIFALALVDQRTDWVQYVSDGTPPDQEILEIVGDREVYWEGGLELLWYKMRKSSFYSCDQGAGVMFQRDTALEYRRRSEALSRLNTSDFADKAAGRCFPKADPEADGPTSADQLASVCGQLPELELIVLKTDVADVERRTWRSPVRVLSAMDEGGKAGQGTEAGDADLYYIYDCGQLLPNR